MSKMLPQTIQFSSLSRHKIEAQFSGGHITSDAGLLLLREVDRQLGLTDRLARKLVDWREPGKVKHSLKAMLRQRLLGIAAGYCDLNDHTQLRQDMALQT